MANNTNTNPLIIDTLTSTAILATANRFQLLAVQWVSGSTANVCSVQDGAGTVRWEAVGNGANYTYGMAFPDELDLTFQGLKVPTLDSGKVYLYVKYI